jgi:hypothetical protein
MDMMRCDVRQFCLMFIVSSRVSRHYLSYIPQKYPSTKRKEPYGKKKETKRKKKVRTCSRIWSIHIANSDIDLDKSIFDIETHKYIQLYNSQVKEW